MAKLEDLICHEVYNGGEKLLEMYSIETQNGQFLERQINNDLNFRPKSDTVRKYSDTVDMKWNIFQTVFSRY